MRGRFSLGGPHHHSRRGICLRLPRLLIGVSSGGCVAGGGSDRLPDAWSRQRERAQPSPGTAGDRRFHLHNTESSGCAQLQAPGPGTHPHPPPSPVMSPRQPYQVSCKCHITLGRASQIARRKLGRGKARNVRRLPGAPPTVGPATRGGSGDCVQAGLGRAQRVGLWPRGTGVSPGVSRGRVGTGHLAPGSGLSASE